MDARQDRKRGVASTSGGDEASSPTKRRRLGVLDGESDGIDNERAKITELARTDVPATAESDGTHCSRFRYYGALASTSVSYNRWSERRILPTHTISGEQQQISDSSVSPGSLRTVRSPCVPSAMSTGNVTPPSNFDAREFPTPQPKTVPPTVVELGKHEQAKKIAADTETITSDPVGRDWGFEGKWTHLLLTACADGRYWLQGLRSLIRHLTGW